MFEDIAHLITPARTKNRIRDCLTSLVLVRYASLEQLQSVKSGWSAHVAQKKIFTDLLQTGYIQEANLQFFTATLKTVKLLELQHFLRNGQLRYRADVIEPHQQLLTDILLKKIQEPDFYTIFYPNFTRNGEQYLRPDAGLIFVKDGKQKLTFLEVERTDKDERYLIDKNQKYQEIAKSMHTYTYLKGVFEAAELKAVEPERFCFGVECYGQKQFEWSGWEWKYLQQD